MNGSGVDSPALADGGVGGVLLLMPTVASKQVTQAGIAETISCGSEIEGGVNRDGQ